MIFDRLYGGMGNQMFQYAFGRKLQKKYGGKLYLDVSDGTEFAATEADKHRATVLGEFSIPNEGVVFIDNRAEFERKAGKGIKLADFLDKLPRAARKITKSNQLYRKLVKLIQNRFNSRGYFTAYDCFVEPAYPPMLEKIYINGLFTSRRYFEDIYENLKCEFEPKHMPDERNQFFLTSIKSCISVCVHVRKGNSYLSNPYLNVCDGRYFEEAMDRIEKVYPSSVFFIFSNDFNWCKDNIDFNKHRCVIVDANDGQHAVDELRLMKACQHFILSNSTMGWWAQYLSDNKKRMVVSPSTWAKGKISLLSDLIEKNWELIEV
jgi:hypothetical protein